MCIGFWSLTHPEYSLILCTNRDEYLSRPTEPAHWHSFESLKTSEGSPSDTNDESKRVRNDEGSDGFVLSGIDILAGGTWFGINRHGDVALLTNITEPMSKLTSSRGHLCSSFLLRKVSSTAQSSTLPQFVDGLTVSESRYAGFNMLLLAPEYTHRSPIDGTVEYTINYDAAFVSNGGSGNPIRSMPWSTPQSVCGCISNDTVTGFDAFTGLKTDAEWPKSALGRDLFSTIISRNENETEDVLVERLFDMLRQKKGSPPQTRRDFQETIMVDAVDLLSLRGGPSFAQTPRNSLDVSQAHATKNRALDQSPKPTVVHKAGVPVHGAAKHYATRLASVLLIRKDGTALFVERDVWIKGEDDKPVLIEQERSGADHERRYSFQISRDGAV